MQGLMACDLPAASSFCHKEMLDLAGSAFSAGCVCAIAIAMMVVFSDLIPSNGKEVQRRKTMAKAKDEDGIEAMFKEHFDSFWDEDSGVCATE